MKLNRTFVKSPRSMIELDLGVHAACDGVQLTAHPLRGGEIKLRHGKQLFIRGHVAPRQNFRWSVQLENSFVVWFFVTKKRMQGSDVVPCQRPVCITLFGFGLAHRIDDQKRENDCYDSVSNWTEKHLCCQFTSSGTGLATKC